MADFVGPDASMPILRSRVHGEQADRFQLLGDGTILKGDGSGSLSVESATARAITATDYDADGNLLSITVEGATTAMTYNPDGTVHTVMFPDDTVQTMVYDVNGNLTGATVS